MKGYDYNAVLSVFYISYIVFEIPSNMACKWIGPGWFIPAISLGFGICSLGTAFVHNIHAISGVRFLLGIFEAGMLPGIAYYLSRWYRRSELAFRLSLYIVMAPLAGAFGGLLASAILKLGSFGSLHSWRMIFAIEGIITIGLSIISFFTLTDRPATAKWLTPEEKDLAIARVKSERVGTTEVLDKIDRKKMLRGIFSPVTLSTSFIFLLGTLSSLLPSSGTRLTLLQTTSLFKASLSSHLRSFRLSTPKIPSSLNNSIPSHHTSSALSSRCFSRSSVGVLTDVSSSSSSVPQS
jgi:MFS family permease